MAIYHASTKPISRSSGRSAVAAIAYRTACRLVDERTGQVHDYTRKGGVVSTEILLPDGSSAERNTLWNAAEAAEKRKDARTAREWIIALPSELDIQQRQELAVGFAVELVTRYGVAVDLAIHRPDSEGDNRNHHAHLLTTTRQVHRDASGALVLDDKASIELSDTARRTRGLGPAADEVTTVRKLWERVANQALERAGHSVRIDARSLKAQGIDREATRHLGPAASEMERRGIQSDRGDMNRQAAANSHERARLQAEVIDLQERRERANQARREKAAQAREAQREATGRAVRESIEQGARELERMERERAAQAQQRQAQEKARKEAEERNAREKARQEAERARQAAQEQAQREKVAAQERQAAPVLTKLPQRLREFVQGMSAAELQGYIERQEPDHPRTLALLSPEYKAAGDRVKALQEAQRGYRQSWEQALREADSWRLHHPVRAKAHDRGWMTASYLSKREWLVEDAKREWIALSGPLEAAQKAKTQAFEDAVTRIQNEQASTRALLNKLGDLLKYKQSQEAERRELVSVTLDVARLYREGKLNVSSSGLRHLLDQINAMPGTQLQKVERLVLRLEREPQSQGKLQSEMQSLQPQLSKLLRPQHEQRWYQSRSGPAPGY